MKKVILALVMVLNVIGSGVAQTTPKFGHINSAELMGMMPERLTIQSELEAYAKSLEAQMAAYTAEYEGKVMDYQKNESTWSTLIKDSKAREISDLERRIQEFQQNAQQSVNEKEQSLVDPLIKKAKDAIDAVAKANGYTYVFDSSTGSLLVFPTGDDILPLVKKYLGIQ